MIAKRIIPCLDVRDGRVVKGIRFVNIRDAGDPVELAKEYNRQRADELVFLDITASYEKRQIMLNVVKNVSKQVFIPLTVGGGIKTIQDIKNLLDSGADKISINTAAVENPNVIRESSKKFGSQCIVLAIDARRNSKMKSGFEVVTYGGRKACGIDVVKWAKKGSLLGAGEILLTSMDRDGTKLGFDLELTRKVSEAVGIPVIASGGGGSLEHFVQVFKEGKADAALAASIFHYNNYKIEDIKRYCKKHNIIVRG